MQDERDKGTTYGLVSTVGFIVGVAGVGAGLALLLLPSGSASASTTAQNKTRITPTFGANGGGVSVLGSF